MPNLKPARVKVVQGEAIPPHEFIPCDCAACWQSQEAEFVVTYARVLMDTMVFRSALRRESKAKDLTKENKAARRGRLKG